MGIFFYQLKKERLNDMTRAEKCRRRVGIFFCNVSVKKRKEIVHIWVPKGVKRAKKASIQMGVGRVRPGLGSPLEGPHLERAPSETGPPKTGSLLTGP